MKGRGRISPVVHKREAHYRTLFERVPVALYRTTLAGRLVDANPALLRMLGYSDRRVLLDCNVTEFYVDPLERTREQALLAENGAVTDFEMRLRRGDDAVIWVRDNARAVHDRKGNLLYYEGSLEDITARRQAEEGRARREREMNALYATSLEIHAQHDLPALLQSVVARAVQLSGLPSGGLMLVRPDGETLECVVSHNLGEAYLGLTLRIGEGVPGTAAATQRPVAVEDCATLQGEPPVCARLGFGRLLGVPLRAGHTVLGVLAIGDNAPGRFSEDTVRLVSLFADQAAIAIDNSRRYAEEQERGATLAAALERQRELDRLHNEFIQNVSHELRTPLNIVHGYAELLECGDLGDLASEQANAVNIIARRSEMLGKLVEDIIVVLHVEGKTLKREPVDIALLAIAVVSEFRIAAVKAGLRLVDRIDDDVPVVAGDPLALRRVLDNLLGNACKFTPSGGTIELRVTAAESEPAVRIEVSDTGMGIPADKLDRIFDRFYQIAGTATRGHGGMGLGLALVKEIVSAHGGTISVTSEVGRGTTFTVLLPAAAS